MLVWTGIYITPLATEFSILVFYELKTFEILTFSQYCSDEGFDYICKPTGRSLGKPVG